MSELKPCPLCGSTDLEISDTAGVRYDDTKVICRWVYCHGCEADGPPIPLPHDWVGTTEESREWVIDKWNDRVKIYDLRMRSLDELAQDGQDMGMYHL
jgi:Lar family restriction alleviation protein